MTKYNAFLTHEVAFFPIKYKVSLFTSNENFLQIRETIRKTITNDREIIHEDFHDVLNQIIKNS